MKVLALDYGVARTGAAVSDPTGTIARPLPAIRRVDSPDGRRRLLSLIDAEGPELIVVGEPRLLSGRRGDQAQAALRFVQSLRTQTTIPIEMVDERLSTVEAGRRRREAGLRGDLDSMAACVILDAYLARVG